ncbi:MAG TPA: hypothetical protein VI277_09280 [Candidatus Limnocylindria bacterium]
MGQPVLPQRATAANAEVISVEWLFEPSWPGDRLMARVDGGRVSLTDAAGQLLEADMTHAIDALAAGVRATAALVDGIWTAQRLPDTDRQAFVAVDLVELDGELLHDVPFQERRRLLESVIAEGEDLRLSPVVKHPVAGWMDAWRAGGFTHYLAKHQNSRYSPGEENDECLELPIRTSAPHGVVAGLVGRRDRVKRIRD